MKHNRLKSKNLGLLLLAAIVLCVVASYALAFNRLHAVGATAGFWFAISLLATVIMGLLLFLLYASSVDQLIALAQEVEQQKTELNKALRTNIKTESDGTRAETIDIASTLQAIIPAQTGDNPAKYAETTLANIAKRFEIVQGTCHIKNAQNGVFEQIAGYAFYTQGEPTTYVEGETLPGQVAKNQTLLNLNKIPENYATVISGLGKSAPKNLLIFPIITSDKQTMGIIELSSFKPFSPQMEELFGQLGQRLGQTMAQIPQKPESK